MLYTFSMINIFFFLMVSNRCNFISNILFFQFLSKVVIRLSPALSLSLQDLKLWQSLGFSYRSNYLSTCMGSFEWLDKIACEKFEKDLKKFFMVG